MHGALDIFVGRISGISRSVDRFEHHSSLRRPIDAQAPRHGLSSTSPASKSFLRSITIDEMRSAALMLTLTVTPSFTHL